MPFFFDRTQYGTESFLLSPTRRTFLQQASAFGLLYGASRAFAQKKMDHGGQHGMAMAHPSRVFDAPMLHTLALKPFVEPLPLPEIAKPVMQNGKPTYTVTMQEIHAKVHPDVPATRMWSYGPTPMAPLIVARKGEPISIEWRNHLPTKHFLPIDYTLHGCGHDVPEVRAVTHLHGAKTRSIDDGYPENWYVPGKSHISHYPMDQEASALWYHDHAMGLNRLNTYAGLFGMLLIRDEVEDALHLPKGKYEIPLILYDRDFSTDGQLQYGASDDPQHPWISEFSADGLLVNGKIRPYFEAEPTTYRLRMVNVANSRFFNLTLSDRKPLVQIGSDQGLLAAPVPMPLISLAPSERADILLDLAPYAGQTIHLQTGAMPILELRVARSGAGAYAMPKTLRRIERTLESAAVKTRTITLHDYKDPFEKSAYMLIDGKHWHEPVTERPKLNSTEIWEFVNLTEDTHPMHLHLVRFQVLDRRAFNTESYFLENGVMRYFGAATPPDPNEMGWKDVVQCPPGAVTRIIVKFEGYPGKYLYHCHILEHESNDMMRPFEVVA